MSKTVYLEQKLMTAVEHKQLLEEHYLSIAKHGVEVLHKDMEIDSVYDDDGLVLTIRVKSGERRPVLVLTEKATEALETFDSIYASYKSVN